MQSPTPAASADNHFQSDRTLVPVPIQIPDRLDPSSLAYTHVTFQSHPAPAALGPTPHVASAVKPAPPPTPAVESCVIPAQITFTGEATFDCDVRIAGNISGKVSATNGHSVLVEKGANVNGTLTATHIHIDGTTEGEIVASGGLASFSGSAISKGHITYARLRIAEGAEVEASMKKLVA